MNRSHLIAPLLVGALAGLGPVPAATAVALEAAAAATGTCSLRLVTTKAVNLQHDGSGTDEVRAHLGNTNTRTRAYTLGQRRNTLSDGTELFSDTTQLSLQVLVRDVVWRTIDTRQVRCEDRTRDFVLSNSDARYKTRAIIEVLP